MRVLRKGFTTGAAAAAATKAAIYRMAGQTLTNVAVTLPDGTQMLIPVSGSGVRGDGVYYAEVIKDGGDDPDVTSGAVIRSVVKKRGESVIITGGTGVGRVTKPGLPVAPGEAAINPVPRRMILQAVREAPINNCLEIIIEVPQGKELAEKTLNPRLGIIGGISILGTTGIVEPMSEEAWKDSLALQLKVIRAAGFQAVVLTPGRQGVQWGASMGIPTEQIAEMSNFAGFMLDECADSGFTSVLLWGHYSKLLKVAAGNFNTHSRLTDAKFETLTAITAVAGGQPGLLKQIFNANTTEEAIFCLETAGLDRIVLNIAAGRASARAMARVKGLTVGCVLLDRQGRLRGWDENAKKLVEAEKWPITGW
ncbi:MAG: cobalt-precorrin-5B (C(1))-methyltransferase CbiD [Bacillota bacterium]